MPTIPDISFSSGMDLLDSAQDGDITIRRIKLTEQLPSDLNQYGYGFWMRYLTRYPFYQWAGKNQAWYAVSRLSLNNPGADIGMGDRLLAIW